MWKRLMDHKGVPKGCGICEFLTVEGMLKCLRLLKGLKIEEDYELSVNLGQKTEAFLRYWRESKKYEWIEAKHRAGLDVDMKEIERKESNGEPLEWELEIISKDYETRLEIENILANRSEYDVISGITNNNTNNQIAYATSTPKVENTSHKENCSLNSEVDNINSVEESDKKDFTPCGFITSGVQTLLKQKNETYRSKDRQKNKRLLLQKLENKYKDEMKKWVKKEEERERKRVEENNHLINLNKKRMRLYEDDINYNSDKEEENKRRNHYYYKERTKVREREKAMDRMLRTKLRPDNLLLLDSFNNQNELILNEKDIDEKKRFKDYDNDYEDNIKRQKKPKDSYDNETKVIIKEVVEEEQSLINKSLNNEGLNTNKNDDNNLLPLKEQENDYKNNNLNKKRKKIIIHNEFEDELYTKKSIEDSNVINPESLKNIELCKVEYLKSKKELEKKIDEEKKLKEKISGVNKSLDLIELQKLVYEQIPKTKKELFEVKVPWEIISENNLLESKIKPWLNKKIVELLGESDSKEFVDFVFSKILARTHPEEIINKLESVFADGTEKFVMSLWKCILFEAFKLERLKIS